MTPDHYPYVWLGDDGILRIDYGWHPTIDLQAIQSAFAQHLALGCGPRPVLICGQGNPTASHEAERFASSAEVCSMTRAVAIMAPNMMARLLARVYLAYNAPPYPCRSFDREEEALTWLRGYLSSMSK